MDFSNRQIAAAVCRTLAMMAERGELVAPYRMRDVAVSAVRRTLGAVAFDGRKEVSREEAVLMLCMAAAILEDAHIATLIA